MKRAAKLIIDLGVADVHDVRGELVYWLARHGGGRNVRRIRIYRDRRGSLVARLDCVMTTMVRYRRVGIIESRAYLPPHMAAGPGRIVTFTAIVPNVTMPKVDAAHFAPRRVRMRRMRRGFDRAWSRVADVIVPANTVALHPDTPTGTP